MLKNKYLVFSFMMFLLFLIAACTSSDQEEKKYEGKIIEDFHPTDDSKNHLYVVKISSEEYREVKGEGYKIGDLVRISCKKEKKFIDIESCVLLE